MAEQVEQLRLAGNECFKAGDYAGAVAKYDEAVALAPGNHLLYSNRSLAQHSAGEYEKAEADARKCLEIAPQFMKGVYRLANAQMGLERFDDAEATIRGGLARDPDNPELKKLARIVKGKRDKARRGKLAKTAAPEIDAQTKKEAQDLSEKLQQHGRELNETKARLNAIRREIQRTTITRNEIAALDDGTEVFRAVGKMFLLSDKPGVDALLGGQLDKGETRASQLTARAQFLDRRIKEQTSEFQQLVQTAQAQAVAA
mmetsp:Transcript_35728/g.110617  ORF Transcript_35728/g.110617 Transcript_35728/m.110617 type:complete len:258 (-) Transcript_35728:47-820(-)